MAEAAVEEAFDDLDVAAALERLRLAEARLTRQRQTDSGLSDTDRAAMRYILESAVTAAEITPSMIASRLRLSPAAGTALVDRLVAGGFVSVDSHPTDRRKKVVTPSDRNLDPDHIDPVTTRLRRLVAQLSPEDAAVIAKFLHRVVDTVGDLDDSRR
jgi:DNA-binding MarR family transcriptional regulator